MQFTFGALGAFLFLVFIFLSISYWQFYSFLEVVATLYCDTGKERNHIPDEEVLQLANYKTCRTYLYCRRVSAANAPGRTAAEVVKGGTTWARNGR